MARFRRGTIATNGTQSNGSGLDDQQASTSMRQQELDDECRRRSRSGSRLFLELSARRSSYFSKFVLSNIDGVGNFLEWVREKLI